jgi:hypothetical protein
VGTLCYIVDHYVVMHLVITVFRKARIHLSLDQIQSTLSQIEDKIVSTQAPFNDNIKELILLNRGILSEVYLGYIYNGFFEGTQDLKEIMEVWCYLIYSDKAPTDTIVICLLNLKLGRDY